MNNQRHLTLAVLMYAGDNDGLLPWGWTSWAWGTYAHHLGPYVGETVSAAAYFYKPTVFRCPTGGIHPAYKDCTDPFLKFYIRSIPTYGYNAYVLKRYGITSWYGTDAAYRQTNLSQFADSANTWVFIDSYTYTPVVSGPSLQGIISDYQLDPYGGERAAWDLHNEGANVSFLDGHVKWYKKWRPLFSNP